MWRLYRFARSVEMRNRIIEHYLPLVKLVAIRIRKTLPCGAEKEELSQAGALGLIDAVEKFDQGRGLRFETYAPRRIAGAMLDYLRAFDFAPALSRRRRRAVEKLRGRLLAEENRESTPEEISEAAPPPRLGGCFLRAWRRDVTGVAVVESVDALRTGDEGADERMVGPADEVAETRTRMADKAVEVRAKIAALPRHLSRVIEMHYFEGLQMSAIAKLFGVTGCRVSQLHAQAIAELRSR